ncbi:hypothetical protein ABRZ83_24225 [Vibrio vulnificus]
MRPKLLKAEFVFCTVS